MVFAENGVESKTKLQRAWGRTRLGTIEAAATVTGDKYTYNWLEGVA